ncbi:FecR domain-containing protein [Uliginosibacterium sp. 31-16]|uniref:FecR domain-containing protein n=1 Tax=Uliginosibacterium sp. 31-16 TaxID=3068315 RepID=UPI00273DEA6D|nr:FecR domain-containing protein [Uliginosibacterium sp. 31-16]MDP5239636.1 FecR domain-containing protein [Uliginosibacterium sp. 31-16]
MNAPVSLGQPNPDSETIPQDVVTRAAEWMARLWSGEASEDEKTACAHWRAAHPDNERAWKELQIFEGKLDNLPRSVARHVLREPADHACKRRRNTRRLFGLSIVVGGATCMLRNTGIWQRSMADYTTATGDIREIELSDGTRITLASATTIDVIFNAQERRIALRAGEILISTAPDPAATHRPFRVHGRDGCVEALGTRFSVRQDETSSRIAVFEGSVKLRTTREPGMVMQVGAGQGSNYSSEKIAPVSRIQESAAAWSNGVLLAENMRVADFVAELGRYRQGLLQCDPAIADLRVSGVFSLRDTDRSLKNISLALPVTPVYRTRYWVTLQAA